MVSSKATSVDQYLADLPEQRRAILQPVRQMVLDSLQDGFVESMTMGMPTYEVPLSTFPDTYNKKPMMYCAIAAQKNHNALYLCGVYSDPELEKKLRDGYAAAGLKLNMGKSCIRFKQLEQLPLDVVAEIIAGYSVAEFIQNYHNCRKK